MRFSIIPYLLIIFFLYSSCSIKGSFQGLKSYYKKTNSRKPGLLIRPIDKNICELRNTGSPKVYIINSQSLSECLKSYEHSLVYIWAPKCKSKYCYPLNLIQQKCDKKNITLYIVAEYYDSELMDIAYSIKSPIFGIDTDYYETNTTSKYLAAFLHELTLTNGFRGRFLDFTGGKFNKVFDDIGHIL